MLLIHNRSTDPAFNLALEEHALTKMSDDILMLWRNDKAVVIGKNQNALAEIDRDYLEQNGIALVRRLSGGGAVYHDLGNINYTMISRLTDDAFGNYDKFSQPVCAFLATLGLSARHEGRNDILLDGKKISGCAQAAKGGRFMHHGTLLFDTDFVALTRALTPAAAKLESKGVKSIRSRVTNISDHLAVSMASESFLLAMYDHFAANLETVQPYELTQPDIAAANHLAAEKHRTWQWSYGASPQYNYTRSAKFDCGMVELRLNVTGGIIEKAAILGDFFGMDDIEELETRLTGLRHDKGAVRDALQALDLGAYISGLTIDEFASLL